MPEKCETRNQHAMVEYETDRHICDIVRDTTI